MYSFSKRSQARLETCHPDIQKILNELIKIYDISVLEGSRSDDRQAELFALGRSKLDGKNKKSKHQSSPSMAVDIMPYKKGTNAFSGDAKDKSRFYFMMGLVRAISKKLLNDCEISHDVRFGLDWDSDNIFNDQNFDDLPHFELIKV